MSVRRQLWGFWAICFASLAVLLAISHLVPGRRLPWDPARTAVVSFVLVILSLPLAVSTFALREKLSTEAPGPDSPGHATRVRATLLRLWARCLLIGLFGCLLAYGSGSPVAAWPYISASAVLLALHAPRHRLIARPPP
jgi:hypothetical protein